MSEPIVNPGDEREKRKSEAIRDSFQRELNGHGYGFQFSVLREAQRLADTRKSKWQFSVSEFPVEVQGLGTKIDFILMRGTYPLWRADMICECKRANPAKSNWCFIRAPYVHRGYPSTKHTYRILESAVLSPKGELRVYAKGEISAAETGHVGLAVTSTEKGDARPGTNYRTQLEDAATQVMRGVNGYIEKLASNPQLMNPTEEQDSIALFVPTIFTTATLWVSHSDLASANLETGTVDISLAAFERVPWLWYQYNVSPGLKHSRTGVERKGKLEDVMQEEYIRSIAVVSAGGIPDFLESTSDFL